MQNVKSLSRILCKIQPSKQRERFKGPPDIHSGKLVNELHHLKFYILCKLWAYPLLSRLPSVKRSLEYLKLQIEGSM